MGGTPTKTNVIQSESVQQTKFDSLSMTATELLARLKVMNVVDENGNMKNLQDTCANVKLIFKKKLERLSTEVIKEKAMRLGWSYQFSTASKATSERERYCQIVYQYFSMQVKLIQRIKEALEDPLVESKTRIFNTWLEQYDRLPVELQRDSAQKMLLLTRCLSTYYSRLLSNLEKLGSDNLTMTQLEDVFQATTSLINDGRKKCCATANALNRFDWTPRKDDQQQTYFTRGSQSEWSIPLPIDSLSSSDYDVCRR